MSYQCESIPHKESKHTELQTKDLNLAAFVLTQPGVTITSLQESNRGKRSHVVFVLDIPMDKFAFNDLIKAYTNEQTLVEPRKFISRQESLRDLIHGGIKQRSRIEESINGEKIRIEENP